ncbi:Phosphoenolpyruvate synthase/pyruvate phosphate dikinase [Natronincola peptidivorans]|uniref:Phosphoenolpyruvate synthase/pyruvate phosphate dikinase n=1 Tax=Natronincola peptidivorans TaxID=426128 RepID=A0A1H9ZTJ8_9FIRM|nr:PEP/pyruvate-binding domain-containing protein [Natronincola peptidivorans]SES85051.1 Phosphoenolpyruvate synthase/pyruvate phosphate dikinase [Natronincola peptidivorans]
MDTNKLSTKANTLKFLFNNLKNAKVLPILTIHYEEFCKDREVVLNKVKNYFDAKILIIRSSSKEEDTAESSNAGKYESILNVNKNNDTELLQAIERVFNSYEKPQEEEILIQPMLKDIIKSGVVFTCDLDTLAPYYIINYDESDRSDTVTGGSKSSLKTYIYMKESPIKAEEKFLNNIIDCCKELEALFNYAYLDIEFGIDKKEGLYIFQVRPIIVNNKNNLSSLDIKDSLRKICKKVEKLTAPHPNLLGDKTVFGVMPDWNPAEIIGLRPKKLSISLYKELIMDNTWAYQRDNYGYRNLRSHPLMVSFLGIPFIDVRITFNSFIPKKLHDSIAEKLMNYYIDKLINKPSYHDKVEFEIVHSCYYLSLPDKLKELKEAGFTENEIKRIEFSLLEMTNKIIDPNKGLYKIDIEKNKVLEKKFDKILNSELSIVDKIYWLLEDCKRYGTLPFAGVARAAFIAIQFLKSFVDLNIIDEKEYEAFLNSLNTINKQMNFDLDKVFKEKLSKEEFIQKYGHIRPGTYDILSLRYDENYDHYFVGKCSPEDKGIHFTFSELQLQKIDDALVESGIAINAEELIIFIKEAIEGREYTKYVFTKSLSKVLQLVEEFGNRYIVSREDLAFLDIQRIKELYSTLDHRDVKDIFMADIEKNKEFYQYTKAIKLPSLIIKPEDVYQFYLLEEEPNFITLKSIKADVIKEKEIHSIDVKNKIVMIQSADPGYDFLFPKDIGGLITQFGGANSHMAIRCAELGIPAVIGAGEKNFAQWSKSKILEIDCLNKQVRCFE